VPDTRAWWGHIIVLVVLIGGFYSLVIYPFVLDDLVKGAIIGFMGSALTWEFGSQVAGATARQQQGATAAGAVAGATIPSITPIELPPDDGVPPPGY